MIALTTGLEIGVDVEQIRPLPDMQSIADRSFRPEEASEIMSLPQPERDHAFYRCWTRKEAYIKAIGDGLSAPLDDFRVTVQPNTPARFVHIEHDASAAQRWTLHDLQVAAGYAAALAYHDQPRSLSMFPITDFADLMSQSRAASPGMDTRPRMKPYRNRYFLPRPVQLANNEETYGYGDGHCDLG